MISNKTTLFWFRQDLRLSDNPALYEAAQNGTLFVIYIWDDKSCYKPGEASLWWLHQSLKTLNESLGNKLNFYQGDPIKIIPELAKKHQINQVFWNRCYDQEARDQEQKIKNACAHLNISCHRYGAQLLFEPTQILKADNTPYQVFTSYKKNCLHGKDPRPPLPVPHSLHCIEDKESLSLETLKLLPKLPWYKKFEKEWKIGEKAAEKKLAHFISTGLSGYQENRNIPSIQGCSHLSPHLHFGEISPHQVWDAVKKTKNSAPQEDIECFLNEIIWREFSYYLLYHFPELPEANFQKKFNAFPWKNDKNLLKAWTKGKTGYPIVDAGMRELWQTGYMHNRVRMITASFLVKNLFIHWHYGRDWFWDCLLDADLGNNSASWQWVAGSGADAAPYFRIFNPILQGEKFDPQGIYTRQYVPELAHIPDRYLYKPWEAPEDVLRSAGINLGKNYPRPIVSLEESRKKALEAYKNLPK